MKTFAFEKLVAWNEAREWVKWIYKLTEVFPKDERYGLVTQIRRASISVMANLAEGCSRRTAKDQAHFSQLSYSSLLEVLNHLLISTDLGFMKNESLLEARALIEALSFKVNALRNSQLKRIQ